MANKGVKHAFGFKRKNFFFKTSKYCCAAHLSSGSHIILLEVPLQHGIRGRELLPCRSIQAYYGDLFTDRRMALGSISRIFDLPACQSICLHCRLHTRHCIILSLSLCHFSKCCYSCDLLPAQKIRLVWYFCSAHLFLIHTQYNNVTQL